MPTKRQVFLASCALAALIFSPTAFSALADENIYSVRIEGCPSTLSVGIPIGFRRAQGATQVARRNKLLETLHKSPSRKARYSDVFLADWNSAEDFPQIFVGSLGVSINRQGKYSKNEWDKIRSEFYSASMQKTNEIAQHELERRSKLSAYHVENLKAEITSITEENPESVVMLGSSSGVAYGKQFLAYTGAKLAIAKQCIAFVSISVDATGDDSMADLIKITSKISVK